MQNVAQHFKLWQTTNGEKQQKRPLTQIKCSQTREATDERLSLGKPATHPIGTVDKLGRAAPLTARGAAGKKQSALRVDVRSGKQYVLPSVCLDLLTCCQHRGHFGVCVCQPQPNAYVSDGSYGIFFLAVQKTNLQRNHP